MLHYSLTYQPQATNSMCWSTWFEALVRSGFNLFVVSVIRSRLLLPYFLLFWLICSTASTQRVRA